MFITSTKLSSTKIKIINSALTLFMEKGYFNTSIPDLVKYSGVSTGSIYHAFKDKEAIAEALMQALLEQIDSEQKQILNHYQSSWDRYYQLCKWMIDTAQKYPEVMQFVLNARHKEFLPNLPPICSSQPFMNLRDVVQQGMNHGEVIEMDLMVAASSSFGGVLRLIQLGLDGMLEQPLPHYLDSIIETSWRSIAVQ